MASQSIKVTARNQMGHKDINVTLGIYTSLDKKFKKKKINLLDGYLSQETGSISLIFCATLRHFLRY